MVKARKHRPRYHRKIYKWASPYAHKKLRRKDKIWFSTRSDHPEYSVPRLRLEPVDY